ncbi:MAG: AI-2E family transporter [Wolbachia endosymbiont of Meromenopon meropis]|nr:AI-2E family transporter [Wolbachia endosymbiont of Meromenopon meropis]
MEKRYAIICLINIFIIGILFLIRFMIFPCLISIVAAYLFNPLVVKFEGYRIPRLYSVIIIILVLLIIFVLAFTFVLPIIYVQINSILNFLVSKSPSLNFGVISSMLEFFDIKSKDSLLNHLSKYLPKNYDDHTSYLANAINISSNFIIQILNSGLGLIHILSSVVITPVIFFYVLRDWPLIIGKINKLIPISYRKEVENYFSEVNYIVYNYIKGQANICIFMMIFYSVGLSMIGLRHSTVIGVLSGILTFIPYLGPVLYTVIGFLSTFTQFTGWVENVVVLILFGIGQFVDSNILVPLLIGKKVRIHPAIIILGLAICASYFGFVGILLFVPMIAMFYVLVKYITNIYLKSDFYKNGW